MTKKKCKGFAGLLRAKGLLGLIVLFECGDFISDILRKNYRLRKKRDHSLYFLQGLRRESSIYEEMLCLISC